MTERATRLTDLPSTAQIPDRLPVFAEMREAGPVIRTGDVVVTTTRAAAEEVLRNPARFSSRFPNFGNTRPMIPIQIDPPQHRDYRRMLDPLFSPRAVASLAEPIAELVNGVIDGFVDHGECVFDKEFAVPIPSLVFLTMLGLPPEDAPLLLELKDGILRPGYLDGVGPDDGDEQARIQSENAERIYAYFQDVIDARRAHQSCDDIMGTLVSLGLASDEELLDICFLMLIAGLDTVTDSLTLFYAQLAARPELRSRIAEDPAVIPSAVEELLRWETPTPSIIRVTVGDDEIAGCPVAAGDFVVVDLGAANVDPSFQPDATELDLGRSPNPHYSFGGGIHRCLGSHLARQELHIALREWHRRIPDYRLKPGTELIWPPGLRSVENVVLNWELPIRAA